MNQRRTLALGAVLVLVGAIVGAVALGALPATDDSDGAESDFDANGTVTDDAERQPNGSSESSDADDSDDPGQSDDGEQSEGTDGTSSVDESQYPARVELYDGDEHVTTIHAETATTGSERYTGLSEHESLNESEGMLFVYDEPDDLTYVMRRMSFGIDILFIDANGCVDAAHAAPQPEAGEDGESEQHQYSGHGQYVLEVPIGVATDAGVEAGDRVRIEYDGTVIDGCCDCAASG